MFKPFIDVLYSIAIGIGFTEFPSDPLENIPGVIFFLVTLFMAALDWYYYAKFENTIPEDKRFTYYFVQILTVLILSQLFKHACAISLRFWIAYLIIFLSFGTYWNNLLAFQNHKAFIAINIVIIIFNILLLIFYTWILNIISISESSFRYVIFCFEAVITFVSIVFVNKLSFR